MRNLYLDRFLITLMWALVIIFLYVVYSKRNRKSKHSKLNDLVEDPNLLRQAEENVQSVDVRQQLSEKFDYLETYSTMQGYRENYMNQLVSLLEENQMSASFIFVEAGPIGMMSLDHRAGTFELYVEKGKVEAAVEIIRQFKKVD